MCVMQHTFIDFQGSADIVFFEVISSCRCTLFSTEQDHWDTGAMTPMASYAESQPQSHWIGFHGKIYRKPLYLMEKHMVSSRFSLKQIQPQRVAQAPSGHNL